MTEPALPLAVYGTLRRGERNHSLLADATHVGDGVVAGVLHHVPAAPTRPYGFPALVAGGDGRVRVELYRLANPGHWAKLDALELYDPSDEARSEFLRRTVDVREGPIDRAQIYVYHGPLDVLGDVIDTGDWISVGDRDS